MKKIIPFITSLALLAVVFLFSTANIFAQSTDKSPNEKTPDSAKPSVSPKVTLVNEVTIKELLKPKNKPLLVNFWATWCIPCREEFPDLVELDKEFKGKIDFITITLDDPAEIDRDVPKFLKEMNAEMPTYLLRTPDENAVISSISKDWAGGLPFTVLYNEKGEITHIGQGKIKPDVVWAKISKVLDPKKLITITEFVKIKNNHREEAVFYYENNWKILREAAIKKGYIHSYELIVSKADEKSGFDIILITRFADIENFNKVEENFQEIMKEVRDGSEVKLKNELKPDDFRENIAVKTGNTYP
jgi:thiol-disulfide isomerase/thioredoxin